MSIHDIPSQPRRGRNRSGAFLGSRRPSEVSGDGSVSSPHPASSPSWRPGVPRGRHRRNAPITQEQVAEFHARYGNQLTQTLVEPESSDPEPALVGPSSPAPVSDHVTTPWVPALAPILEEDDDLLEDASIAVPGVDHRVEGGVEDVVDQIETREAFLARMDHGENVLRNHVPSSGMGKFDAEYRPHTQELLITVKIHFRFADDWADDSATETFKATFIHEVQESWSRQYTFSCRKEGFEDLRVTPVIHVDGAATADDCHYDVTVGAGAGRAMVGRQGSVEGQTSLGFFYAGDVERKAHTSERINCSVATHERERLERVLQFFGGQTSVQFDDGSAVIRDTAPLDAIADALDATGIPGAPLVPLTATGYVRTGEKWFESRRIGLEKRRGQAVAEVLGARTGRDVKVRSHTEVATPRLKAAKTAVKEQQKKIAHTDSDRLRQIREANLGPLQDELAEAQAYAHTTRDADYQKVEIGVDRDFEQTFTEDAYSVAVHEFGHMLGNPDEYFPYGAATLDRRIAQLLASGDPAKVDEARRLQERRGEMSLLSDSDQERQDIQENWSMMIESAGLEIPQFGSTNSSLMSAGTSLLPRHYVGMWEALGAITSPTIRSTDWTFD